MSGDRHLRPDPDGRLRGSPANLATVLVTAAPSYSSTVAGQHLLQGLVNLLARQFGVVQSVLLDVEDSPVHPQIFLRPRLDGGGLTSALVGLGQAVGGELVETRRADEQTAETVVVCVGDGLNPARFGVPGIAITGEGWRASARTTRQVEALSGGSTNPLGPHLAACLGAAFVFMSAYGKQRHVDDEFNLWWDDEDGPDLEGIELPPAYVLGLGAVGAAFGYELASARALHGQLVAVDPQEMSETDRNRLLSGDWGAVGEAKTDLFEAMFENSDVAVATFQGRWPQDYLGDPYRRTPDELRAEEREGRFRWVISCVDRDRDRVGIAAQLPRHVLAGSTLGMAAQSAYYSLSGASECLACRHRTPQQVGVEALAEQLRSFTPEERRAWYGEYGATPQARASIDEYLTDPSCAGPGAADLAKLGLSGRVDWAVGFVSAAAGIMLASRFIRASLVGVEAETARGSEMRLLFWVSELRTTRAQRAVDCPVCREVPPEWAALWGSEPAFW